MSCFWKKIVVPYGALASNGPTFCQQRQGRGKFLSLLGVSFSPQWQICVLGTCVLLLLQVVVCPGGGRESLLSDLASCWSLARQAVAWAVRRVMDVAESIRAVLFMFGGMMGLGQPEDKVSVTLILLMIKLEFALQTSSAQ